MLCAGKAGQNLFCVLLESPGRKMKMSRLAPGIFFVKTCAEYLIGYFLPFSFLVITTRIV